MSGYLHLVVGCWFSTRDRISVPVAVAPARERPHSAQWVGIWGTTWSGSATWARWVPGSPGCFPGLRRLASRAARRRAARLTRSSRAAASSREGGSEELLELRPILRSTSTMRSCSSTMRSCSSPTRDWSCSTNSRSAPLSASKVELRVMPADSSRGSPFRTPSPPAAVS